MTKVKRPQAAHPKNRKKSLLTVLNFVRVIWFSVCITGCIYQLTQISQEYFAYPVTSEVTIKLELHFNIPAVSFCVKLVDTLKEDNCSTTTCKKKLLYQESVRKLMNDMTIDIKENFAAGFQAEKGGYEWYSQKDQNLNEVMSTFYKSERKCVRFNKNQERKLQYDVIVARKFYWRFVLSLLTRVKREYGAYYTIFIHEMNTYPRGYIIPFYNIENKKKNISYSFSFKKTKTKFLPPPYFSRCTDYHEINLESRDHCVEECVSHRLLKSDPGYTDEQLTVTDYNHTNFKLRNSEGKDELSSIVQSYDRMCKNQCPLSCNTVIYMPILWETYNWHLNNPYSDIRIKLIHIEPTTFITLSGKLSFVEYLIYVASITSLWFGFVIFDSSDTLKVFFSFILSLKKDSVNLRTSDNRLFTARIEQWSYRSDRSN